jgi:hypothetical protein
VTFPGAEETREARGPVAKHAAGMFTPSLGEAAKHGD